MKKKSSKKSKQRSKKGKSVKRTPSFPLESSDFFFLIKNVVSRNQLRTCMLLLFLFSFIFSDQLFAQHAVSTVAGSTQGFMDANGTAAKFKAPTGICISPDGASIYVADYSGHRIRKIDVATNAVSTIAGNGTSGYVNGTGQAALFSYPSGICISPNGTTLYVCDYGNGYIRKIIIATQTVSTIAGNGNFSFADNANGMLASFNGLTDIKNSGDSVLYVSDTDNHLLRKINISTSSVSTLAGMNGVGGFQNGSGISAAFRLPKGLALSADGATLFVADNGNNMIRAIELANVNVTTVAGDGTAGFADNTNGMLAQFNSPNGVAVVPGDNDVLYVADNINHRIRKITISSSAVTTVGGTGATPPSSTFGDNANGLNAKFFYPTNLIISPDSKDVFVADQGNFRIRKVKTDLNIAGIAVSDFSELKFDVYPNPCSDLLFISGKTIKNKEIKLELFDNSGKVVLVKEKNAAGGTEFFTENISGLENGFYFLKISQANGFATKKIIISR